MGASRVGLRVLATFVFLFAYHRDHARFAEAIVSDFALDWESGFPDGSPDLGPSMAMEPSFSLNRDSSVQGCSNSSSANDIIKCKCGVDGYSPRNCDIY